MAQDPDPGHTVPVPKPRHPHRPGNLVDYDEGRHDASVEARMVSGVDGNELVVAGKLVGLSIPFVANEVWPVACEGAPVSFVTNEVRPMTAPRRAGVNPTGTEIEGTYTRKVLREVAPRWL